ncbi:MAG: RnfABCDGE type electron transport complex subunit B [Gammaproteobacteria bacterium]|nr:RnfABCDGE type electron transport complex subunit B [Gammaproteobacteria bacterium]
MTETLATRLDAALPQHQCQRCGYDDCRSYAEAIAAGKADINRCSPGGELVIESLAELAGRALRPLAADVEPFPMDQVARIDPATCIGCTKCLPPCPVDAIVGAPKYLHEVMEVACTGCGLCIPACPVDCISLVAVEDEAAAARRMNPPTARTGLERARLMHRGGELRERYRRHEARRATSQRRRKRELDTGDADDLDARRAEIAAAVERVRARRAERARQR